MHRTVYYTIDTDPELRGRFDEFRDIINNVLTDPRGWRKYNYTFIEQPLTKHTPRILRIKLATLDTIKKIGCGSATTMCNTAYFSFYRPRYHDIHINVQNWDGGSKSSLSIPRYRIYVINHEVGHALGLDHVKCPASRTNKGSVMQQMTRGPEHIAPCFENEWPLDIKNDGYDEFAQQNKKNMFRNDSPVITTIMVIVIIVLIITVMNTVFGQIKHIPSFHELFNKIFI